ncbi:MAG TPA: AMP-binding protein [Phycisphaerae bacterium]|nr:AMP-binding protein [Phycisphaerae bacterium]
MQLLHDLLTACAQHCPEHTALVCDDATWTFGQLDQASDRLAAALQRRGLRRGERAAVFMENSAELVIAVFAILKAGGVFTVINPTTKGRKLVYLLNDCGVRFLFAQPGLSRIVAEGAAEATALQEVIWSEAPADSAASVTMAQLQGEDDTPPRDPQLIDADLATIIYTSGSTGGPKGVMLTHRNVTNTAWAISTYLENTPDDIVLCVLPLSFDYGLYQVLTGARVGFTVVLERSFAYPYQTLRRMAQCRVTGLPGVPTVFATLLQMAPFDGLDLSCLRYLSNTAAAFPPAHIRRLQQLFPQARIYSMYGLTECTRVSYLDPARLVDKIGSVGKAMPNSETYIVDEQGRRVAPGEVGELVIRGANVMRGYWGKPEATAERLRDGPIAGEKVLYSGDLFYADEEGFLYFVGRKDDVFKCKGEKISPKEIEAVLYELEAVAEAAVVGVEDPIDGHAIKAFVVPRAGHALTEQQVRYHCRARLENYMLPKFVTLCTALPKTESGKIRKASLTESRSLSTVTGNPSGPA